MAVENESSGNHDSFSRRDLEKTKYAWVNQRATNYALSFTVSKYPEEGGGSEMIRDNFLEVWSWGFYYIPSVSLCATALLQKEPRFWV